VAKKKTRTPTLRMVEICDQVIRHLDGKFSLIGVFSKIITDKFPCTHDRCNLFLKITDAAGSYNLRITVEHNNKEAELVSGKLEAGEPKDIFIFSVELINQLFGSEGVYDYITYLDGVQFARTQITLEAIS